MAGHYKARQVNKHELVPADQTSFKMIRSNASLVLKDLDELRKNPKKFICLNDDMDATASSQVAKVRLLLRDYYLSLFPEPSSFELPKDRENTFGCLLEKDTLEASEARKRFSAICLLLLAALIFALLFCFKARYRRK